MRHLVVTAQQYEVCVLTLITLTVVIVTTEAIWETVVKQLL